MQVEGRVVITKLLLLSQDPQNQTFVARDEGCMNGLVASLKHIDSEVILIASRALQFLSGHPQNKKIMREFPSLVENLIHASAVSTNVKTKQFCADALDNLGVSLNKPEDNANPENEAETDFVDTENFTPNKTKITYQKVLVYVDGLGDSGNCVLVQRILLNTPGVISVELDKQRGIASVGTRDPCTEVLVKKLCDALHRAGLVARSNPRAPLATEVDEDADNDMSEAAEMSGSLDDDSGYLDETEYYAEKESAMTRWGPSSLEARLEQERREEEARAAQTGRILSKVGNALTNASSWLFGY